MTGPRAPRGGRRVGGVRAEVDLGTAELVPDRDRPGSWTLMVDGTPQSHVDLSDPTYLDFEYVRWLGHLIDAVAPSGAPLRVLHLGGGAWTLARYVAATRPGSRQRVVEVDGALVDFVRRHLPDRDTGIRVRVGDGREVLARLAPATVDVLVVDAFSGARVPPHLTSVEFVRAAAGVLRPGGTYALNVADGAPLAFARGQAATVAAVLPHTCLIAMPQVLRGRRFGNVVIVGSGRSIDVAGLTRRVAADPFAARVVHGEAFSRFAGGAAAVTDAGATPSPLPPDGVRW